MKIQYFLIATTFTLLINGCIGIKDKSAEELLKNPKTEDEIYSAILADNTHLSKFVDRMLANENCQTLMTKKSLLIKMVCMSEKMDSIMSNDKDVMNGMMNRLVKNMEADSTLCDNTCTKIMENNHLKNYFKEHSNKK